MKSKKPKPKPFMEPFEKKVFNTMIALLIFSGLCYAYFFSQYYSFTDTINDQTARVAQFYKENTP